MWSLASKSALLTIKTDSLRGSGTNVEIDEILEEDKTRILFVKATPSSPFYSPKDVGKLIKKLEKWFLSLSTHLNQLRRFNDY